MNYTKSCKDFLLEGMSYLSLGLYDDALLCFDKAIRLNPGYKEAYENRTKVFEAKGDIDNIEKSLEDQIEVLKLELFLIQSVLEKKYDLVIKHYEMIIKLNPSFAEAYYKRGSVYSQKKDYDNAFKDFNIAIELEPDSKDVYFERGMAYIAKRDYDYAMIDLNKAIDLKPESGILFAYRGTTHMGKENFTEAFNDFNKAIYLKSDEYLQYLFRGRAYFSLEEFDYAIKDFNRAIDLNPNSEEGYSLRGVAYARKNDFEIAINDLNKSIAVNPEYGAAYGNRGMIFSEMEDYDNAVEDCNKYIQIDPDLSISHSMRGGVYAAKKEYDKAIKDFDKAIELDPKLPDPFFKKAIVMIKKEEAILAYPYLLKYYFLESHYEFQKNSFSFIQAFNINQYVVPLFLSRVFHENDFLFSAISLEHFYEEIHQDSSEKLTLIKSIGKQESTNNNEFIDDNFIISVDEISGYKIKGLLYYYYGDPIYSKQMFDEIDSLDETDLMGQYYLLMSLIQYLEDYSGELENALMQCKHLLDNNMNDKVQLYYAGQIYLLNNDLDAALTCFTVSTDFLPSRFMQVVIHTRLENKIEQEKCIKSIFENTGDEELEELKLLLNGKIIETDLEDESWVNLLLFNAHVNEISDARNIIFDWLDDEQNKKFYPQYWERGLIFDYTPDSERKAYKVWKATEETSRKLNDLSESIKLKYFSKLESKVKEQFPDIFDALDSLDGNRLESIIANKIQELKITDTEKDKYSILIAYSFLKDRLSIHQNIFLNSFLVVKFHFDNQKEWQISGRLFEAAIMVSFATPLSEFIGHTIGVHHILPHIFFHTVGQTFYQKTEHFLKTKVLDKLRKKRDTSEPLTYNEFKKMYIEYVSELKEEEVDLFEKWDIDGLEEWYEKNK